MFGEIADIFGWIGGMLFWCCKAYCITVLWCISLLIIVSILAAVAERIVPAFRLQTESLGGSSVTKRGRVRAGNYRLRW